jgi:uncharacterized membrane protein
MEIFQVVLVVTTLLCALVAGLVFSFAVVVMPGIGSLDDRGFIRGFQVIDGVIQKNQPLFMLVWLGSIVAVLASLVIGFRQLDGIERLLLIFAGALYLLFVHLPTFTINVPLNNKLQALDVDSADDASLGEARRDFESRWMLWNSIRTVCASLASVLLMILLLRM